MSWYNYPCYFQAPSDDDPMKYSFRIDGEPTWQTSQRQFLACSWNPVMNGYYWQLFTVEPFVTAASCLDDPYFQQDLSIVGCYTGPYGTYYGNYGQISKPYQALTFEADQHTGTRYSGHKQKQRKTKPKNRHTSKQPEMLCKFCRSNGSSYRVYSSHWLKNAHGEVTCPVLKEYVCPECKQTGPQAHTLKYCPNRKEEEPFVYRKVLNSAGRVYTLKY